MVRFRIWDPLTRLVHWSLAAAFVANALVIDPASSWHLRIGQAVALLLAVRGIWGLVGPFGAQLGALVPAVPDVRQQLDDMASGVTRVDLGHSPLSGLMALNLLVALATIAGTGLLLSYSRLRAADWLEDLHENLVVWTAICVVVHIAAVVRKSLRNRVNHSMSMITGIQTLPDDLDRGA